MLAVGYMKYGGPEVLEIFDLPEVHAGPGQLRIRNRAATVNPTDLMARSGLQSHKQKGIAPPYVPGMEAAGVVDEVGEGVTTGVKVGDPVLGLVIPRGDHGAYREQIVLNARSVVAVPAGKSFREACTLPMNGITARKSLDLLNLCPVQTIAITCAAGDYGGLVIVRPMAAGLVHIATS